MRRTVILLSLPAFAAALSVLRLESPVALRAGIATSLLAVAPALLRPLWARAAAAVGGGLLVIWLAFGPAPWDLLPGRDAEWLAPVGARVDGGLLDFADEVVPFDPSERPDMHGLMLAGLFLLLLGVGLAVAARRTLLAGALVVAGGGWSATLVEGHGELAVGALVLASVLWLIVLDRAPAPRAAAVGVCSALGLVALAAGVSTSGAVSSSGALDWRAWDLYRLRGSQVGVQYVWDANYGGIDFPKRQTTVLRIRAPERALYWRASTLDTFTADRWIENLYPVALGPARGRITRDPMLPTRASDRSAWVRQEVRVEALRDDHLVAAATPMTFAGDLGRLFFLEGGVTKAPRGLSRGRQYTIRSYVPSPTPQQLRRARPLYPPEAGRYVSLDRAELPLYGEAGRAAYLDRIFRQRRYERFWPYRPLWAQAERLAGRAKSPYAATLAIERWLRAGGGFRYEEHPPRARGTPPLADFVVRSRAGYCQHFAGTMALMLRMLGIPARVAVGFTSGSWKDGVWTVADRDAHAWVEAWFEGWGWLPFDPTPGRGTLSALYTLASDSADAIRALGGERLLTPDGGLGGVAPGVPAGTASGTGGGVGAWPLLVVVGVLGAVALVLGLAKLTRRRVRYLTRDPRRLASAARAELADWMADQGVDVTPRSTARELAAKLESRLGVSARAFAATAARARYGPPEGAAEAARVARGELRIVLRALRTNLSPRKRLRGFLTLRSLRRGAPGSPT